MRYSETIKEILYNCIDSESKCKDNFRNPEIDFSRTRKLTFSDTFKIILSMGGNTLENELLEHFDYKLDAPTSSAFVQSRDKILPKAFENVFKSFNKHINKPKLFKDMRLVSVDGSNINLYRNPNDEETHIANSTHCGHNAMHLSTTFDLLNQTYLDAIIQPANGKDERGAILEMVPNLPENSILIADRGYESYNLLAHLGNRNLKYLIRVKDINSNGIASGFELPDTEFDVDLEVNISNKQSIKIKQIENYRFSPSIARFDFSDDENPVYNLKFRLTRILLENGKYECIISNLPKSISPEEIEWMYFLRWGIETSYRQLKYSVGLANLHTKKKDSVIQEIYAKLIMYNFCEAIAQNVMLSMKNTIHTYKINFTRAIKVCRKFLRLQFTVFFDVEALISKFLSAVRHNRTYERPLKTKRFTSFIYRVA